MLNIQLGLLQKVLTKSGGFDKGSFCGVGLSLTFLVLSVLSHGFEEASIATNISWITRTSL